MKQTKVSEARKLKTEDSLKLSGHNVEVLWDTVYKADKHHIQYVNVRCNICGDIAEKRMLLIANGTYVCNHCSALKYQLLLSYSNWKYIKHGSSKVEIQCSVCGNVKSASPNVINNGDIPRCDICNGIKYKSFLSNSNWNYISHGCARAQLECTLCGNIKSVKSSSLLKGHIPVCLNCNINRYKAACEKFDLKYLSVKSIKSKHLRISTVCKICGEIRDVDAGSLLVGSFRCSGCKLLSYKSALLKRGCELISVTGRFKKSSMIQYRNKQGDEFSASSSNVLTGRFETSVDGHWRSPHSTYIVNMKIDENLYICK